MDAARLGQMFFFDTGFSKNKKVACATCHQPKYYFTDGLPRGFGMAQTKRNTLSLLSAAYSPWQYWDGRKDSLWAQALEPLVDKKEQGFSHKQVYKRVRKQYRKDYEAIFGDIGKATPNAVTRVFVNVGKALMAYQRQLKLQATRFDIFVEALTKKEGVLDYSQTEFNGLKLFMGKAACVSCHNGPLFTNFEFHNIGAPEPNKQKVDLGRYTGVEKLRTDEFNCLSIWSDAKKQQCEELDFLKTQTPELVGAFKTPSLRNVAATAPYMQGGQLPTLEAVIDHYNKPLPPYYDPKQHPNRPHFDVLPLTLSDVEKNELVAFLRTLTSTISEDDPWWRDPR